MKIGRVSASCSVRSSVIAVRPDTATLSGTRSRTRSRVCGRGSASAGAVVGMAGSTTVSPAGEACGSPTVAMPGSAATRSEQRGDGLGVHAGAAQVGDEQQRGVDAWAEALGQQVVGATVRGGRRVVAGVREAGLHPQRRGGQREQDRRRGEQVGPRPTRDAVGEAPPRPVLGRLGGRGAGPPAVRRRCGRRAGRAAPAAA